MHLLLFWAAQERAAHPGKCRGSCCSGQRSAVNWGSPEHGGDSSSVEEQLSNVQHIQATQGAFAAVLAMDPLGKVTLL